LKCAAEEASLESLQAKEQVSQFLEQGDIINKNEWIPY
jgi:hypothetical protein